SLKWDGTSRIERLMIEGFGTLDSQYYREISRCFLISIAARICEPGCKVDTMPVFEGPQGNRKSSALRALGGKFFTECHEKVTSKDFYSVLHGHFLVEIAEMDAFSGAQVETIKGVISNQVDRYRLPYDKHATSNPRQCVFAGTTNRRDWNRDETGA